MACRISMVARFVSFLHKDANYFCEVLFLDFVLDPRFDFFPPRMRRVPILELRLDCEVYSGPLSVERLDNEIGLGGGLDSRLEGMLESTVESRSSRPLNPMMSINTLL